MKLSSWQEIGSDGDILLMPYIPKGITGYDDELSILALVCKSICLLGLSPSDMLEH